MWFQYITQAVCVVAGGFILHYGLSAIDNMNSGTNHAVRVAFILLAAGGFAQMIDPLLSREVASGADLMLSGGLALLLVSDRRCTMCPRAAAVKEGQRRRDARPIGGETT